ncbi:MAG: hypothetical protein AAF555_03015 [Verrucomicrobiota bacterium]
MQEYLGNTEEEKDSAKLERLQKVLAKARQETGKLEDAILLSQAQIEAKSDSLQSLEEQLLKLRTSEFELSEVQEELQAYQKRFRVAFINEVRGRVFEEFPLRSGRTLEQAEAKRSYPDGILFQHSQGIEKVSFQELSPIWHEAFKFSQDKALDYLEASRKNQQAAEAEAMKFRAERDKQLQEDFRKTQAEMDALNRKRALAKIEALRVRVRQLRREANQAEYDHWWARYRGRSSSWNGIAQQKHREADQIEMEIQRLRSQL